MPIDVKNIPLKRFDCHVDPDADIRLSIVIGNGQVGRSRIVNSGGQLIAKGKIVNLPIGKGSELIGKEISVFTNVLDVNQEDEENLVMVSHTFFDPEVSFEFEDPAPKDGLVSYEVIYTFV